MQTLRTILFNILFFLGTIFLCLLLMPIIIFGHKANQWVAYLWCSFVQIILKFSVGIEKRILGYKYIPNGLCIFVVKHQSIWETLT